MKRMEFEEGQTIFNQGDHNDLCYQIVTGAVEIRLPVRDASGAKQAHRVETLHYGDVFGEMGIIDDSPRSASAVAAEPTVCVAYTPEEILDLLESNPKEALDYIRTLIRRLRTTNVKGMVRTERT